MTEPTLRSLREALGDANHAWRALDAHATCVSELAWRIAGLVDTRTLEPLPTPKAKDAMLMVDAVTSALVTDAESLRDTVDAARRRLDNLQHALAVYLANA
jgi:hypothetical protein